MAGEHILVMTADAPLAAVLVRGLVPDGYGVTVVSDAFEGESAALTGWIDLVIFDLDVPGRDGLAVLEALRRKGCRCPVVALASLSVESPAALARGADDLVVKPVRLPVLKARLGVRLRTSRANRAGTVHGTPATGRCDGMPTVGGVTLDRVAQRAAVGSTWVELTPREFALAEILMLNAGRVVSVEELVDHVWRGELPPGSNLLRIYVGYLRRKLGPGAITTIHRSGYRFDGGEAASGHPAGDAEV